MMKMMAALTEKGQTAYAKAGAFAAEVIAGIRTVASFASEPAVATNYKVGLKEAKLLGIRSAVVGGTGIGITMFIFFGVYGLALWYGSTLVANGVSFLSYFFFFQVLTKNNFLGNFWW